MDLKSILPPTKTPEEIMAINTQIASYKKNLFDMNLKKQSIKIPQRTLIYQHQNLKFGGRNIENINRKKKMQRRKLRNNILRVQSKIKILQSSI